MDRYSRKKPSKSTSRNAQGRSKSKLNNSPKKTSLHRNITQKQTIGNFAMPEIFNSKLLRKINPEYLFHYWFSKKGALKALKLLGAIIIIGFISLYVLLAFYDGKANLGANNPTHSGNLTIYDSTGNTIIYSEPPQEATTQENLTSLKDFSPYIQDASIAIEDKNFYHENGVDILAIFRSAVHDASSLGTSNVGGSTITEQTVKLDDLKTTDTRTIYAKFSEFFIAIDTNRKYTKQAILTHYLNIAPYGDCNGVEAAAQQYFGVNANQLTIAESALLASIPKSPTVYAPSSANPYFSKSQTTARMDYILQLMHSQGYITKAQYESALKEDPIDLALSQKPIPPTINLYPNFSASVIKEVSYDQTLSPSNPRYINPSLNVYGLKIISTLNISQQQLVENGFKANTTTSVRFPGAGVSENILKQGLDDEAFVAENVPTGQITAMVGSFDESNPNDTSNFSIVPGTTHTINGVEYGTSTRNGKTVAINSFYDLNCATNQLCVEPGSSFKLYDYSALLNDPSVNNGHGAGAGSVLYDEPSLITCTTKCSNPETPTNLGWACKQTSGNNCLQDDTGSSEMNGPITLRYALGNSLNIPAVKSGAIEGQDSAGVWKSIDVADEMMGSNFINGSKTNDYVCIVINRTTGQPETTPSGSYVYSGQGCASGEPLIGDQAQISLIDHVNGYATAARLGNEMPYTTILKITNPANNDVLFKYTKPAPNQVINSQTEYIMMNMLSDHNASFMANLLTDNTGFNIAYKSGTQFEQYNGLLMAADTQYAVGMWVGCPDHCTQNPICNDGTSGSPVYLNCGADTQMEYLTVPLVKSFMLSVLKNKTPVNWVAPKGIQTLPAFCQTRRINSDVPPKNCTNYTDIYPSWYKPATNSSSSSIDIVSGDLATSCTPALATKTINPSTGAAIFSIDPFTNAGSNVDLYNTSVTDPIHLCSDQYPKVTWDSSSSGTNPTCSNGVCDFGVDITEGTHPLTSTAYPLQVNAQIDGGTYPATCTFSPVPDSSNFTGITDGTCTFTDSGVNNDDSLSVEVIDSVLYSATTNPAENVTVSNVSTTISLTVGGSSSEPTVLWTANGSDVYQCTVSGQSKPYNITSSSGTDTCAINGLTPGTYTVTITDTNPANPATGTANVSVTS